MKKVFYYNNYRTYLADFYKEQKEKDLKFSYTIFAKLVDLVSSHLHNVIKGEKNLGGDKVAKICIGLKFSAVECAYFDKLVAFNQAKSFQEKKLCYSRLNEIVGKIENIDFQIKLRKDQYDYYAKWYNPVIRGLIGIKKFRGDFEALAKSINPFITKKEAKDCVFLLLGLGIVYVDDDGVYKIKDQSITTGPEVKSLAVLQYHIDMLDITKKALETLPQDKRNVSGVTVSISQNAYKEIIDLINETQKKISKIAESDPYADSVYQISFIAVPMLKQPV